MRYLTFLLIVSRILAPLKPRTRGRHYAPVKVEQTYNPLSERVRYVIGFNILLWCVDPSREVILWHG